MKPIGSEKIKEKMRYALLLAYMPLAYLPTMVDSIVGEDFAC